VPKKRKLLDLALMAIVFFQIKNEDESKSACVRACVQMCKCVYARMYVCMCVCVWCVRASTCMCERG
jgi:hypothetical protein